VGHFGAGAARLVTVTEADAKALELAGGWMRDGIVIPRRASTEVAEDQGTA
jgi:hypothetical protein